MNLIKFPVVFFKFTISFKDLSYRLLNDWNQCTFIWILFTKD